MTHMTCKEFQITFGRVYYVQLALTANNQQVMAMSKDNGANPRRHFSGPLTIA